MGTIVRYLALAALVAVTVTVAVNWFSGPRVAEHADAPPTEIRDIYDPVAAGEPVPDGFRQLLAREL